MAAPRTNPSASRRKPLVFLVDDEPTLLDLLEFSLQHDGFSLRKFLDPEAALRAFLAARIKPALLVTDYAMGKMSGLELIEKCRAAKPDIKTVMVSGTASSEIALRSPAAVDRFLAKPYQPAALSEIVRAVLARDAGVSA